MKSKYRIKKPFYKQAFPLTIFILLIVYVISLFTPFLWAVLASFNSEAMFSNQSIMPEDTKWDILMKIFLVPTGYNNKWTGEFIEGFTLTNYSWSLDHISVKKPDNTIVGLPQLILNSLVYSIGCTVITATTHVVTAYASARYGHHKIASILYPIVIITMIIPIVGSLPAELDMMRTLGTYDNIIGLLLMKGGFLGSSFLIYYATFKGISWEYAEAAFIDGASHFKVLIEIMVPLAMGSIAALMLMNFIAFWNDWKVNIQYLPFSWPMVSYALFLFQKESNIDGLNIPRIMAGCIIIAIPLIILFIVFKDKLMNNLTVGGLKG
ncbi:MAG: carbohydrate ABC transporter permease [Clostridia bacterium]|nr:carbohydrate ABC transporter permease [Clostridia bacterium]